MRNILLVEIRLTDNIPNGTENKEPAPKNHERGEAKQRVL